MRFGTPRVTNGVVYACASAGSGDTFAFNAGDGSLRWRARTDCWIVDIPFEDNAVPMVKDGIVYDGTYALRQQDGTVLWRTAINTQTEGALSLQALVGDTLYANTENYVFAINARNGKVLWRYGPDTLMPIGGALVVADHVLYVGTLGSVDHPEASRFYALDADTGKLRWQYRMGAYQGAVIHNNSIYVSSRDQCLYALDKNTGSLRWKYKFVYPTYNIATIAGNILYINIDGAYALNSADGTVLWHKELGSSPSVSFTPPVILEGVVYLASIDGSGHSILYALNASNGAEYWHSHTPYQVAPLAVGQ
jgi:outer membrane protein assembly factor BamB